MAGQLHRHGACLLLATGHLHGQVLKLDVEPVSSCLPETSTQAYAPCCAFRKGGMTPACAVKGGGPLFAQWCSGKPQRPMVLWPHMTPPTSC